MSKNIRRIALRVENQKTNPLIVKPDFVTITATTPLLSRTQEDGLGLSVQGHGHEKKGTPLHQLTLKRTKEREHDALRFDLQAQDKEFTGKVTVATLRPLIIRHANIFSPELFEDVVGHIQGLEEDAEIYYPNFLGKIDSKLEAAALKFISHAQQQQLAKKNPPPKKTKKNKTITFSDTLITGPTKPRTVVLEFPSHTSNRSLTQSVTSDLSLSKKAASIEDDESKPETSSPHEVEEQIGSSTLQDSSTFMASNEIKKIESTGEREKESSIHQIAATLSSYLDTNYTEFLVLLRKYDRNNTGMLSGDHFYRLLKNVMSPIILTPDHARVLAAQFRHPDSDLVSLRQLLNCYNNRDKRDFQGLWLFRSIKPLHYDYHLVVEKLKAVHSSDAVFLKERFLHYDANRDHILDQTEFRLLCDELNLNMTEEVFDKLLVFFGFTHTYPAQAPQIYVHSLGISYNAFASKLSGRHEPAFAVRPVHPPSYPMVMRSVEMAWTLFADVLWQGFFRFRDAFRFFDEDHDGILTLSQFRLLLEFLNIAMVDLEFQRFVARFQTQGDQILYNSILLAFEISEDVHQELAAGRAVARPKQSSSPPDESSTTPVPPTAQKPLPLALAAKKLRLELMTSFDEFYKLFTFDSLENVISEDRFLQFLKSHEIPLADSTAFFRKMGAHRDRDGVMQVPLKRLLHHFGIFENNGRFYLNGKLIYDEAVPSFSLGSSLKAPASADHSKQSVKLNETDSLDRNSLKDSVSLESVAKGLKETSISLSESFNPLSSSLALKDEPSSSPLADKMESSKSQSTPQTPGQKGISIYRSTKDYSSVTHASELNLTTGLPPRSDDFVKSAPNSIVSENLLHDLVLKHADSLMKACEVIDRTHSGFISVNDFKACVDSFVGPIEPPVFVSFMKKAKFVNNLLAYRGFLEELTTGSYGQPKHKPSFVSFYQKSVDPETIKAQEVDEKFRQVVALNYNNILMDIEKIDFHGTKTISRVDLRRVIERHCGEMSNIAFNRLCHAADSSKDPMIHYLVFLNHFASLKLETSLKDDEKETQASAAGDEGLMVAAVHMRIAPDITRKWHALKDKFRQYDWDNSGCILRPQFAASLAAMSVAVTPPDLAHLYNKWRGPAPNSVTYLNFLRHFLSTNPAPSPALKDLMSRSQYLPAQQPPADMTAKEARRKKSLIASQALHRGKPTLFTLTLEKNKNAVAMATQPITPQMQEAVSALRPMVKPCWKDLRRDFVKVDAERTGYVSVTRFLDILKAHKVLITQDQQFALLSLFDASLESKVPYDMFLKISLGS